tara:strand:+ start:35 stop:148 length:114 start_codon:yes stop_codon:yes gene_type:complete
MPNVSGKMYSYSSSGMKKAEAAKKKKKKKTLFKRTES